MLLNETLVNKWEEVKKEGGGGGKSLFVCNKWLYLNRRRGDHLMRKVKVNLRHGQNRLGHAAHGGLLQVKQGGFDVRFVAKTACLIVLGQLKVNLGTITHLLWNRSNRSNSK